MKVASPILDTAGNINYITDFAKITGSIAKATKVFSKLAGVIGNIVTFGTAIYQLTQKDEVAVNYLIDIMLGNSLSSNSHENVSALYYYAKIRMSELIKNDKVNYEAEWNGIPKWFCSTQEEINQIKDELKLLNKFLQEEK